MRDKIRTLSTTTKFCKSKFFISKDLFFRQNINKYNLIIFDTLNITNFDSETQFLYTILLSTVSYAGLHCVVIKGYSKSAGYQPGVKFEDNRFRNSWNAVYVAGAWRFVQCNWGARHLVNAKEVPKGGNRAKSDSLR